MKKLINLLFILFLYIPLSGQDIELPRVIPPSPEAAGMTKHVDIPTNNYTGIPNVSIPIYTIKTRELSVPITLSYHAGGLQVDEIGSFNSAEMIYYEY